MSRQFNTQNYPKPRFKKVYLNFLDNKGHYDFRGVVESDQGISLRTATASDFYVAQTVAINYAYLGGIIHECNYELEAENFGNGKQFTFNLAKLKIRRIPGNSGQITSVMVFDYAKAAFKVCYNPNGGWGGNINHPQPNLVGLSPIMSIRVRFAGSTSDPQVQMDTVYSQLRANNDTNCNRFNWKEFEAQAYGYQAPQNVHSYMRYESWGSPGVGFTADNFDNMILSLFDNQTDPRQTVLDHHDVNYPIAAVQYIFELGDQTTGAFFTGAKYAPLAYFIEEDVLNNRYRFNMILTSDNAFNVEGIYGGDYPDRLICKALMKKNDDVTIDDSGNESIYSTIEFDSYPETDQWVNFTETHSY